MITMDPGEPRRRLLSSASAPPLAMEAPKEDLEVTVLLNRMVYGESGAADELMRVLYSELREIAHRQMARQARDHMLQTTGLLNEAWIRLVGQAEVHWESRRHFKRMATVAMRSVLVDYARSRLSLKRGGAHGRQELDERVAVAPDGDSALLELNEALERLEARSPLVGRVAELRCFGGQSQEEIADVLGISTATVGRHWKSAKAWLRSELREEST